MRRFIFLLVIFSSFMASSQLTIKPGIKAGLNLSNIRHTNYEVKPDFYAGISLGLKFSDRYMLQPEILYSRQGARPQLEGGSNAEIQIDYLSIAIANKYAVFKGIKLYSVAGPFFDLKISDNIDNYDTLFEFLDNFDLGFFVGLDYEFSSGIGMEFRYKLGLIELNGVDANINNENYNKVFQFGLIYNFKF